MKRIVSYCLLLLCLNACASSGPQNYTQYYARKNLPQPGAKTFPHCHNYGCQLVKIVELNDTEWARIEKNFTPPAKTAEDERKQIEKAIAEFEKTVGAMVGTDEDVWGTFQDLGRFQLDCVDESTNTTAYLVSLKERGNIKHHDILSPSARVLKNGFPGWPHQTAVIRDLGTGQKYAVDSWFRNNGYPPFTVPFDDWVHGWTPDDSMRPETHGSKSTQTP